MKHLKEYKLWEQSRELTPEQEGFPSHDRFAGLGGSIPRDLWTWRGISIVPPKK